MPKREGMGSFFNIMKVRAHVHRHMHIYVHVQIYEEDHGFLFFFCAGEIFVFCLH